jgi:hypothetical protein
VSIDGVAFNFFKGLDKLPACSMADGALCMFTPEFSPLFHPVIQTPAVPWTEQIHIAFCLLVFARYAVPLVSAALRQIAAALPAKASFAPGAWRL